MDHGGDSWKKIGDETLKEVISDRNEYKLIERLINMRTSYPNMKVGEIKRPLVVGGIADGTYDVEVEY
jgi:hypothetical protein